ncbi:MAG: ABC transporter permease subunit, partial [bacterium]
LARAFGFRVERAFALVFLIGSVLVAPSAVFGAVQTYVRPGSGVAVMLVASIAVFVGGVGNITGAIVTALLIGIAQNVSLLLVPGTWQNALTFGFFLVVMLLRPQGLLAGARRRGRGKPRSAEAMTPTPSVAENPKSLDQSEVRKL